MRVTTRLSKEEARYRHGTASENCHNCKYMNKDGTCAELKGRPKVKPGDVCDRWKKK